MVTFCTRYMQHVLHWRSLQSKTICLKLSTFQKLSASFTLFILNKSFAIYLRGEKSSSSITKSVAFHTLPSFFLCWKPKQHFPMLVWDTKVKAKEKSKKIKSESKSKKWIWNRNCNFSTSAIIQSPAESLNFQRCEMFSTESVIPTRVQPQRIWNAIKSIY